MNRLQIFLTINIFTALFTVSSCQAVSNIKLKKGKNITVLLSQEEESVVHVALDMFSGDFNAVFQAQLEQVKSNADVYVGTIDIENWSKELVARADIEELKKHEEAFLLTVNDGKIIILGSDKRGTAYGILELSRKIGVSPWVWWADAKIKTQKSLVLDKKIRTLQYPSVARRGIFINDEDWGLMPWSSTNYEPTDAKGEIGAQTNARIFELLLRLRANTYWPAMHKCSMAFYNTPRNKEMADKYGIFVGTSHCEPMMRNTNAEWNRAERGQYNYLKNRKGLLQFWEERVKELSNSDNIYTLGLRGEHDGKMEGAKDDTERMEVLTNVIADQRQMLATHVNSNVEEISQVFIPYKEVLDAYKLGLKVPEDVTLMWCDDNYGYVRHFPTPKEQERRGGNGMYYHVSYWGRPHDYLWLATNSPAQIYNQMKLAYNKGTKDMWILNVGDIKPAEYLIEFFLDMAWDINFIVENKSGLDNHLNDWLTREFGKKQAQKLTNIMNEYYRLAYIRKPEFMGHTRVEEGIDSHWNKVSDLPWSENYIKRRISNYEELAEKVKTISERIPENQQSAWFQLVEYPVLGAAEMNKKHLYGQLARHGLAHWSLSNNAFDEIALLTEKYNTLENGKWKGIMDMKPRNLAVYSRVAHEEPSTPLVENEKLLLLLNGNEYNSFKGTQPTENGLGYERAAIYLDKGSSVTYQIQDIASGSVVVELTLAPNHPVSGDQIRYAISFDGDEAVEVNYATKGRSEEWKQNVLRNQAIRRTKHAVNKSKRHTIKITALDEGVVIDQIKLKP